MANRKYANIVQARKAKERQNREYKKRAQTAFTFRFHNVNDGLIIDKIRTMPNKNDYIRQLILKDIEKGEN